MMNTKTKTMLGLAAFLIFLGVAYYGYTALSKSYKPQTQSTTSSQQIQKTAAPDFTVFDEKGNKVKLSDFKGKPVVLNFWASWCPPCKGEMPHFDKAYESAKDNVVFLMVDLTDGERETQEIGQKYVKDQGFHFPVYFDKEQQAAAAYSISAIPDTFFIDKDGNVVKAYQGAIDEETLTAGIRLIQ
jgi:thiol-disulfide isomerase/thioredoxin